MDINFLPIEILFIILSHLDLSSQLIAKQVCQLWSQLIQQIFDQVKFVLTHDTNHSKIYDRCGNFNLYCLSHYSDKMSMVPLLKLKQEGQPHLHPRLSDSPVYDTLHNFKNLRVVYLCLFNWSPHHNHGFLDLVTHSCNSDLRHVAIVCRKSVKLGLHETIRFCRSYPNLKALQFEATELTIDGRAFNLLVSSLTKLEVLVVMDTIHSYERHVYIDEEDINPFFYKVNPSIRVLKVGGLLMPSKDIELMSPLEKLCNLHICDFYDLKTVQLIGEKFKNLLSLTLSDSFSFFTQRDGENIIESIVRLTHLQKLHLFIETENRIFSYNSFSKLKKCHHLKTLQLESTILNSDCIESICRFVPQLEKFDLTYIQFEEDSDHCISWIERLQHLQCLKLSATPEIKENAVNNIIKNCNELEFLDLSRSDQMSDQTFIACIGSAKRNPNKKMTVYFPNRNKYNILSVIDSELFLGQTIPKNLVTKFPTVKYI